MLSPEETNIQMLNKYRVDIPFASGKFSVVCRAYPKSPSSPPPSSSSDDPHHQHSRSTSNPPHSSSSDTSDLEFLGSQSTSSPTARTSRLPLLSTPIKSGLPKELVLKSTPIGAPKDHNEPGLREIRILDQLSRLAAEGKCYNFVLINDWYKTRESIYGGSAGSHAFVHGILEFANIGTLKHHQVCTLELWRNIAFQCLYALYIGQRELQLVHLDLHADNILLSTLPKGVSALGFRLPSGAQYFVATEMVKISDFSLSRIRVPDTTEVLSHKGRSGFEPTADLESLSKVLKQLKVHPPIPKDSLEAQHRRSFLTRLSHCMPGLEAEHIDQLLTMPLFDVLKEMPSGENFLMAVA
ncbi:MAG: hypothetical protein Q8P67_18255 [archaeon]|nr:hypothetical protein [archaeon]